MSRHPYHDKLTCRVSQEVIYIFMGKAVKGHQGFVSEGKNIGSKVGVIGCKFPPEIDVILRSLPNRSDKIRQWVIKAMIEEGLLEHR